MYAIGRNLEGLSMKNKCESGFSLIELLIVVVVISVVAALAIPNLQKGLIAGENGSMFATLRTISSAQVNFYSQNSRFGRLDELNALQRGGLGTQSGNDLLRRKFVITMVSASAPPTNAELKDTYTILATRNIPSEGTVYQYRITQEGTIQQLSP